MPDAIVSREDAHADVSALYACAYFALSRPVYSPYVVGSAFSTPPVTMDLLALGTPLKFAGTASVLRISLLLLTPDWSNAESLSTAPVRETFCA